MILLIGWQKKGARGHRQIGFGRVYTDWKVRENHIKISNGLESQEKSAS